MNVFSYKVLALIVLFSSCSLKEEAVVEFLPDYKGEWSTPPSNTPTNKVPDGAICGNGDIGMVLGGTPDKQLFYFSKNDFWKAQNGYPNGGVCYVGQLQISSSEMKGASYQVEQK
ncbi:MAG: trehalose hydrolase, partial [Parabacteroides gordonii]